MVGALALGLLAACGDDDTEQTEPPVTEPAATQPTSGSPSTTAAGGPANLNGTSFTTTELTVGGQARPAAGSSSFSVSFTDGRVNADFGCNTGSGTYRIEGEVLVVDQFSMTRKGCSGELGDQDGLMSELVMGSPTVQLDGDQLTLTGTRIVFTGTPA